MLKTQIQILQNNFTLSKVGLGLEFPVLLLFFWKKKTFNIFFLKSFEQYFTGLGVNQFQTETYKLLMQIIDSSEYLCKNLEELFQVVFPVYHLKYTFEMK